VKNSNAPVVILDRDGTIVVDRQYLGDPEGLEFLPGAVAGLRKLHAMGCKLIIITNQSGIGRGLLTREQVKRVNSGLEMMMQTIGAPVADTYFCPHAPDANCACRKPGTELLLRAASDYEFDPSTAIVIGDKQSDIELGKRVAAKTIFILGDKATQSEGHGSDVAVHNLQEAAQWIAAQIKLTASAAV